MQFIWKGAEEMVSILPLPVAGIFGASSTHPCQAAKGAALGRCQICLQEMKPSVPGTGIGFSWMVHMGGNGDQIGFVPDMLYESIRKGNKKVSSIFIISSASVDKA